MLKRWILWWVTYLKNFLKEFCKFSHFVQNTVIAKRIIFKLLITTNISKICDKDFWSIGQHVVKNCHFWENGKTHLSGIVDGNLMDHSNVVYLRRQLTDSRHVKGGEIWEILILRELFRWVGIIVMGLLCLPWPWSKLCMQTVSEFALCYDGGKEGRWGRKMRWRTEDTTEYIA